VERLTNPDLIAIIDKRMLKSLLKTIAEIIYPATCNACKTKLKNKPTIDNFVCLECWQKAKRNLPPFCYRCGRHLNANNLTKNICPSCVKREHYFDRAFSPCVYEGIMKKLIYEFKYNNKDYLGLPLSKFMIDFIKEYSLPIELMDFIIPIPLHKSRLREREFNQAQLLSNYIAAEFKRIILPGALKRIRNTKSQTELSDKERLSNIRESFSVDDGHDMKNKNILLVDDVFTTGATTSEAAFTLKEAGANIVFVLTLAN